MQSFSNGKLIVAIGAHSPMSIRILAVCLLGMN
jgi:hypothetical protein